MRRAREVALGIAAAGALAGCGARAESPEQRTQQQAALSGSRRTAIVDAAARVAPSVVSINVTSRRRINRSPFDFFFLPQATEQRVQGYGTGFVIRASGVIVTNQHVVDNAETITVSLPDGSDLPAKLLGEDPTTDIAVVRVDRDDLPVASIGR